MKKMRNRWLRRVWAGLLCMSLMVSCMLPVNAAVPVAEHQHDYRMAGDPRTEISYNEGTHTISKLQSYKCTFPNCKDSPITVEISRVTEGHDIEYTDLGYEDVVHHYRVRCKVCPFRYEF